MPNVIPPPALPKVTGTSGSDLLQTRKLLGIGVSGHVEGLDGDDIILGDGGNDWLVGGSGNDQLNGAGGNDTLEGGAGADLLKGEAGNDLLDGGDGDDQLLGGKGDDTLRGDAGRDLLSGELGNDSLDGGANDDTLWGGDGKDTLAGSDGDDFLYGEDDNDQLDGGNGNDRLEGGAGHDTITGGQGNDNILAGDGNDVVDAGDGDDYVHAGLGADRITAGAGDDIILADDGDDVIDAGPGHDRIWAGAGDDVIIYRRAENAGHSDYVDAGTGRDTLQLEFTAADWFDLAVQNDLAGFRDFLAGPYAAVGAVYAWSSMGLSSSSIEVTAITVDGIKVTLADDAVRARNDIFDIREDATISANVLANDTVPDLVRLVTLLTAPNRGTMGVLGQDGSFTFTADSGLQSLREGEVRDIVFTYRVTDADLDTGDAKVTLRVTGTNDAATISGDAAGNVGEDGTQLATGKLSVADLDAGEATFATPASLAGTYGSFTFNAGTGTWTYTLDNGRAATQALRQGEVVTDVLNLASLDGTATQAVTVTVAGTNDTASIGGTAAGGVTEDAATRTTGGTLALQDVDTGEAVFRAVDPAALAGRYGNFTFNSATGAWTYTLDNSRAVTQNLDTHQGATETLTVTSLDGTATQVITVNIAGTNDGPVRISNGSTGTITVVERADGAADENSGQFVFANQRMNFRDLDSGDTHTATVDLVSGPGLGQATLTSVTPSSENSLGTVYWSYAVDSAKLDSLRGGEVIEERYRVAVSDGDASAQQIVLVRHVGVNDAATFGGDTSGTVREDGTLTTGGILTTADVDRDETGFAAVNPAALVGAYGNFTFDATTGAWTYALDNTNRPVQFLKDGETLTDSLTVRAKDGTAQLLTVTIQGTNDGPIYTGTNSTPGFTVTERPDGAGDENSGEIIIADRRMNFRDMDADDVHTATVELVSGPGLGSASVTSITPSTKNSVGTVHWAYAVDAAKLDSLAEGEVVEEKYRVTVSDGDATAQQTVLVRHVGVNDAAIFGGTTARTITEDMAGGIHSTVTVSDVDTGQGVFDPATPHQVTAGQYGSFTFNGTNGNWLYVLDSTRASVQGLVAGQSLTDTLAIRSKDGTTQNLTVTIQGQDDAAVFGGDFAKHIREDATGVASGQLTVTDADAGQTGFRAALAGDLAGDYGSFTFNSANGRWTYSLDSSLGVIQALAEEETLTDSMTVRSLDGTETEVVVTIIGRNDLAVFGGDLSGHVTEDDATPFSGVVTVSDLDNGPDGFLASSNGNLTGQYGRATFDKDTGAWTYTLNSGLAAVQALGAGQTLTDKVLIRALDRTTQDLTVTIHGTNDAAIITGDFNGAVTEDAVTVASGKLAVADVDAGQARFAEVDATALAGVYGSFTFDAPTGAWSYSLNNASSAVQALKAGQVEYETLAVKSLDGTTQIVTVAVAGANDAAVFSGTLATSLTEDQNSTYATARVFDADTGEGAFQPATAGQVTQGTYGTFTFNGTTGAWLYQLNSGRADVQGLAAGQSVTDTLTIHSADGTAQDLVVTIRGVNDAPVLSKPISDQAAKEGMPLSFTVPHDTFTDVDNGDHLVLSATLLDGSALPSWLSFDGTTFSGTPTYSSAGSLSVRVTARDQAAAVASDIFDLSIANTPYYIGSYRVSDGPTWSTNPPVYSAKQAAALIFGGSASDYIISALPSQDPSTITGTAWYDGWGKPWTLFDDDFRQDAAPAGYEYPAYDAWSAYVRDHVDTSKMNYVWHV
ncbi:VCBS domain-containing protein [Roseomonas sp. SSH11]|uniref:VCBS domain-containing protein n=1 Tax=Pararoseomonas baculiformis TaxID=2820812 RepID=A0ABS4AJT9_9PROT|nr:VCBS domain-containing protein [Pararoseomonas baculiformis]MBP0447124.1 VCBS domain-containing protein [Pararoseomonas baculiformis]